MPFDKVETQVDFPAQERNVLEFWQRINAFEKLREKNKNGLRWSFLDGPITANNPMGVHHAWGRTYKDAYQRYHAMLGQHQRYQNGFDCQGLWVEVEVEKAEGLKSKRDIENLIPSKPFESIDKFVRLCKERVDKFARIQTAQSIRLGYWMDWDRDEDWSKPPDQRRSYFTMSEENNYTIWQFLKKCHQRGLVYRGYDSMPWCPRCSVGLSQMEMAEGYQLVAHRAVFVRFPLRGRSGENLLAWTTTPWTLTSNVAAAVNPDLTYLKVLHKDQVYYVAKGAFRAHRLEEAFKKKEWVAGVPKLKTLEQIFKEKGGYEVVGEVKGADMIGWAYDGPFDELLAQRYEAGYPEAIAHVATNLVWAPLMAARDIHRVIAWKEVGETEGTGIVHIAPGCGKEDFQLGKKEGLPPIAPLDEEGDFLPGFGVLEGKSALDHATTDAILASLREKGLVLEVEKYPHSYPHCWRCKTELLFRLVDEWFIDMDAWREEIMRVVETATFLPESINGKVRELDWLRNMGDWMISKKRFWGLALPIWVDEQTGDFEVIGSRQELKERAVEGWQEFDGHTPHRPWVDKVKIRNPKTGNLMSRIPDVGNPWLDAGIVPFSTMGYNKDRSYWEKWFPADFITESFPGQFRNWFYAILAMSTMMEQRSPFQVLLGHALVRDQWDRPMHKSAGNAIPFEGAADEGYDLTNPKGVVAHYPAMSADVIRWLFCRHNPANNLDFGPEPADEIRNKFILKVWHTYAFFCDLARMPVERGGFNLDGPTVPVSERPDMDPWILSDLQKLVQGARQAFDEYNVMDFCLKVEKFVDDKLSNWYVRRSKRRFWDGDQAAYQTLYTVLTTLAKLCAPVIPFLTEAMYQNLKLPGDSESVHLCDYPVADQALIDEELSRDMDALLDLVSLGLSARNTAKIKVRQPLAEMMVAGRRLRLASAVQRFGSLACDELNIEKITVIDTNDLRSQVQVRYSLDLQTLGPVWGKDLEENKKAFDDLADTGKLPGVWDPDTGTSDIILEVSGKNVIVPAASIRTRGTGPAGWVYAQGGDAEILLDTRVTHELKLRGLVREIVRLVNNERKNAGLDMEDRIELYLGTSSEMLRAAMQEHQMHIAAETLTGKWTDEPLTGPCHQANIRLDGQTLTIMLRKASS
jgi:isoleucyl-tRNA synthetase